MACRLDHLEIDHLANEYGATQVRHDVTQEAARVIASEAFALMAKHDECADAGW
jgi:hypothetical protein